MIKLATIGKHILQRKRYGIVKAKTNKGLITLFVTDPDKPDRFGYSTTWTDPRKGEEEIRTIECTIPPNMVTGKNIESYQIGVNTYLLPANIFNKIAVNWKLREISY